MCSSAFRLIAAPKNEQGQESIECGRQCWYFSCSCASAIPEGGSNAHLLVCRWRVAAVAHLHDQQVTLYRESRQQVIATAITTTPTCKPIWTSIWSGSFRLPQPVWRIGCYPYPRGGRLPDLATEPLYFPMVPGIFFWAMGLVTVPDSFHPGFDSLHPGPPSYN
jgi:hypothetical protein